MRKPLLPFLATFLLVAWPASPLLAQPQPRVLTNLSWDHCAGDGYVGDRTFACDNNTGVENLFGSIVLNDSARAGILGIEAYLDITLTSTETPDWWKVSAGQCRAFGFTGTGEILEESASCLPWYWEAVPLPIAAFAPHYPEAGQIYVASFVVTGPYSTDGGATATLLAGQEYTVFKLRLSHAKTVGTGACSGCTVPACIGWSWMRLTRPSLSESEEFAGTGLNTVTWQGGYVADYPSDPSGPWSSNYRNRLECTLAPVPAQGRTWGLIKTFYR